MEKREFNQDLFDESKLKGKKFWPRFFFALFIIYIIAFVIFMAMYLGFKNRFECVPVHGTSMQPTINENVEKGDPNNPDEKADWVYISKTDVDYGDIVVFDAKEYRGEKDKLIKRVVAFEGDAVTIVKKDNPNYQKPVFTVCVVKAEDLIDGQIQDDEIIVMEEDYTTDPYLWTYSSRYSCFSYEKYDIYFKDTFITKGNPKNLITDSEGIIYTIVPEGEFFYMADNRSDGSDSRARGTDLLSSINGVVQFMVKDAESSSSALLVQAREVVNYYSKIVGDYFSNLWVDLKNFFAI